MSRFDRLPDRAMNLANDVGDRIRHAMPSDVGARIRDAMPSNVGDRVRRALPSRAGGLLEAGVALGAMKTAGRTATVFVRRNPTIAVAALAGAGLLWYAAHRRDQKAERGLIEGRSRRVDVTAVGDEPVTETHNEGRDDSSRITPDIV
ncbi:hypothetical protein INQ40_12895 [Lysobacter sp. H21R4]|uniref:hypothetical protein n=1 Tax=Lysobacter sp. H21R4 TaxID=2781021 RepID=UPI001887D16F|nr:hypothetical protein [Lysobacter sp. H21R4]QOY62744.1 hypothetical protein INQ40_12895 [Lysobacter sp. H21R4]